MKKKTDFKNIFYEKRSVLTESCKLSEKNLCYYLYMYLILVCMQFVNIQLVLLLTPTIACGDSG